MRVPTLLIDARNFDARIPEIEAEVAAADLLGFDIESYDDAHPGIVDYRDADTVVFDTQRTTVAGFSVYAPDSPRSYYVNLSHADVENRLSWTQARRILDARKPNCPLVIHNDPFERTMMKNALKFDVGSTICTLQLAVSTFGPDEYDKNDFGKITTWEAGSLVPQIIHHFAAYDKRVSYDLNTQQATLLGKVVAKEGRGAQSYNGFNASIAYGYGLKKLVRNFLKEEIGDFKELLERYGAKDMRDLTGEQVADYGGDDSYFAVQVLYKLLGMIRPEALEAFEKQEMPMTEIYSNICVEGIHINMAAVDKQYELESANLIEADKKLRAAVVAALPFPSAPCAELMAREAWYQKNWKKYRVRITDWKNEKGNKKPFNVMHYMPMRTMLYDLFGQKMILDKGKVQSDAEARGKMLELATGVAKDGLTAVGAISGIAQRINLYLTPYKCLTDPATGKIYPWVSSKLATRRMAASFPNPMQLQKQGGSTYIRGFYEPDRPEDMNEYRRRGGDMSGDVRHGIMSLDLSQIELVLIGEFSGDPAFKDAYGQLPYNDLHVTAGASILAAVTNRPDFTRDDFLQLKANINTKGIPLIDAKGNELTPMKAYKYNRGNAGGKGANFEFWYSGYLGTVAERRGLEGSATQTLVQAYADAFPVAVGWRQQLQSECVINGFLDLPDGHRRVRWEATMEWQAYMNNYFRQLSEGLSPEAAGAVIKFGDMVIRKIGKRAQNQIINALIQGSCAAIVKRSILKIQKDIHQFDARFMFPVHDELVFSVRWDHMLPFMNWARPIMADHPDFIKSLVMDSGPTIGRTFEPFDPDDINKVPYGQIELHEAPALPFVPPEMVGKRMDEATILKTIEYLRPKP